MDTRITSHRANGNYYRDAEYKPLYAEYKPLSSSNYYRDRKYVSILANIHGKLSKNIDFYAIFKQNQAKYAIS